MRTLAAFAPLILAIFLMQLGVGALGPLDALSGLSLSFSAAQIGLLGSAHFLGFVIGCIVAPRLLARTDHPRAFAAAATLGVLGAMLHPVLVDPEFWMFLRIGTGFAVAVGYTVVESWLQARLTNENRARALSTYRMFDLMGAVGSQLLLLQLEPAAYVSYILVASVLMLSLLPLSLTRVKPPAAPSRPRIRPLFAMRLSPLGAAGVFVVGVTTSSFRMVGPVYGVEFALSREQIAYFLAAAMLGGAVAQPVVGVIADRFDRRFVLIGISAAALAICAALATGAFASGPQGLILGAFLFGVVAMPLYSVSSAYANDYCPQDSIVELNASLILVFAFGAVLSPVLAAAVIERFGPNALWSYIGLSHAGLVALGLFRMTRRPAAAPQAAYAYMPRTSLLLGRLVKPARSEDAAPSGTEASETKASEPRSSKPASRQRPAAPDIAKSGSRAG